MNMPERIWAAPDENGDWLHGHCSSALSREAGGAYVHADLYEALCAENAALREALAKISNRSSVMAWSEDGEVREAMREMEEIAEAALARQTEGEG